METRSMRIAFIVSFALTFIRPSNPTGTKALTNELNNDRKIQENLHNLFDSITKNDVRKTGNYRGLLELEIMQARQAFDTLKEELRFAQQKHVHRKKRNSYNTKRNAGDKVAVFKRETYRDNDEEADALRVIESQSRDTRFREKYCDKEYKAWDKMQEAENRTLANICVKFFSFERESDERAAEAYSQTNRTLAYGQLSDDVALACNVTLDLVQCKIRFRNVLDQLTGEAVYYLTDGYDEGSAFTFSLIPATTVHERIFLGGEVRNIWNQTIHPSAKWSISELDIDFYSKHIS